MREAREEKERDESEEDERDRYNQDPGRSQQDKLKTLFSKLGSGTSFPKFGDTSKSNKRSGQRSKTRGGTSSHRHHTPITRIRDPSQYSAKAILKPKKKARPLEWLRNSLPIRSQTRLQSHIKSITCLELDRHCQRLIAGSNDHLLSFWDLESMNSSLKPFRTLRPIEGQPIVSVSFNADQQRMVVCGGGNQPKLLTRDGREIVQFVYGDQYLKDLKFTKGHTSNITHVLCDPTEENLCYTSSMDGTIRVWDLEARLFGVAQQLPNFQVFKLLDSQKRRLGAEHFCFLKDTRAIAVFCQKGHFQIFDCNNRWVAILACLYVCT